MIEAIPFQKALENIIVKEREKANQKIMFLERNLREMVDALQNQLELKEEARFTLLRTDEAIKNKEKFIFKKPRKLRQCLSVKWPPGNWTSAKAIEPTKPMIEIKNLSAPKLR